jgi:hypothetical protein
MNEKQKLWKFVNWHFSASFGKVYPLETVTDGGNPQQTTDSSQN